MSVLLMKYFHPNENEEGAWPTVPQQYSVALFKMQAESSEIDVRKAWCTISATSKNSVMITAIFMTCHSSIFIDLLSYYL